MSAFVGQLVSADDQSYSVVYDDTTGQVMVDLGVGAPGLLAARTVPLGAAFLVKSPTSARYVYLFAGPLGLTYYDLGPATVTPTTIPGTPPTLVS